MTAGSQRGFTLMEALAATALAGMALAALANTAAVAGHGLRLARDTGVALTLAGERLEALRAGPRSGGSDAVTGAGGITFTRTWTVDGGRGRPVRLAVRVGWGAHAVERTTETLP